VRDKRRARRIWVWGGLYTSDKGAGGFGLISRNTRAHTGSVVNFLGVERSFEVPRIRVHVIVEMGGNNTKAVNFGLVEECDRYES